MSYEEDHAMLMLVSGALVDAGDVPVEPYHEAIRALTKQRDDARRALAEANAHQADATTCILGLNDAIAKLDSELAEERRKREEAEAKTAQYVERLARVLSIDHDADAAVARRLTEVTSAARARPITTPNQMAEVRKVVAEMRDGNVARHITMHPHMVDHHLAIWADRLERAIGGGR